MINQSLEYKLDDIERKSRPFIINFLMLVFLVSCSGAKEEEEFTITNTAGDQEDVILIIDGVKKKLLPNQCIALKEGQFDKLIIRAGLGGPFPGSTKNFCGDGIIGRGGFYLFPFCVAGNYEIQDQGVLIDNYVLVAVKNKNASCSKNLP